MRSLVCIAAMVLISCEGSSPLPDHQMSADPLGAGRNRVQVNASGEITRSECEALIKEYSTQAGSDGQVSVYKPSTKLSGKPAPWCVENFDGAGIRFNDNFFN